jgi:hypothetical protein
MYMSFLCLQRSDDSERVRLCSKRVRLYSVQNIEQMTTQSTERMRMTEDDSEPKRCNVHCTQFTLYSNHRRSDRERELLKKRAGDSRRN